MQDYITFGMDKVSKHSDNKNSVFKSCWNVNLLWCFIQNGQGEFHKINLKNSFTSHRKVVWRGSNSLNSKFQKIEEKMYLKKIKLLRILDIVSSKKTKKKNETSSSLSSLMAYCQSPRSLLFWYKVLNIKY